MTDLELLEQYAGTGSHDAFAQIVRRHADWIHSAARRGVGDPSLADDVTQAVFLLLAQKARKLAAARTPLGGWLFKVTRYSCAHAVRARARRLRHEKEAAAMINESREQDRTDQLWQDVAPHLDEMVENLRTQDRDALLLRFYQRKSMAEVGAVLGVSEDAAKKRVSKAVDNLRKLYSQKGLTESAAILVLPLHSLVTDAAPAALLEKWSIPLNSQAPAQAVAISKGALRALASAKLKVMALGLAALIPIGIGATMLTQGVMQNPSAASVAATPKPTAASSSENRWQDSFSVDKTTLSTRGNNLYFVLDPGHRNTLAHATSTITITVLDETKTVDGVETRVVEKREITGGHLLEVSRSYFAIDPSSGDVYLFGEQVDTYKDDKIIDHDGSWMSGTNGARFGLMMPGVLSPARRFYQELAPGVAMDRCEIVSTNDALQTPAAAFTQCVSTVETSALDGNVGRKWYAPGVGLVKDDDFELVANNEKP